MKKIMSGLHPERADADQALNKSTPLENINTGGGSRLPLFRLGDRAVPRRSSGSSEGGIQIIVSGWPIVNNLGKRSVKLPDDGYTWRKYGEKQIRGNFAKRCYFRCANVSCNCKAIKQSEKVSENSFLIIYVGSHTCGPPKRILLGVPTTITTTSGQSSVSTEDIISASEVDSSKCLSLGDSMIETSIMDNMDDNPFEFSSLKDWGECADASNISKSVEDFLHSGGDWAEPNIPPLREVCLTLSLDGICEGRHVDVGVRVQLLPPENMQFFFFCAEDMASCIGVGMLNAIVVLDKDFQIAIHEWAETDREMEEVFWKDRLNWKSCHSVMAFTQDSSEQTQRPKAQRGMKRRAVELHPMNISSLHGVGFDSVFNYTDESVDCSEVSWPILYDIAVFVVTESAAARQWNNGSTAKSRCSAFMAHPKRNRQKQLAQERPKRTRGHTQGGDGDGDEDGEGDSSGVALEGNDDDCPRTLRVVVHPYPKGTVQLDGLSGVEVRLPRDGLQSASIASQLVIDFFHNRECRWIRITASSRLHQITDNNLLYNSSECFGWYQNEIEMKVSCEDDESGRTAVLEQDSSKLLNPITLTKYTVSNTGALTLGQSYSANRHVNAGVGAAVKLEGGLSHGSTLSNEETTGSCRTVETTIESICGGFHPISYSSSESPACARYKLSYPLHCFRVWDDKGFLMNQGLFSTIEPKLTGTWIPFNEKAHSPYLFCINRKLTLHRKNGEPNGCEFVQNFKQSYLLSFYINHAMTHLRREKGQQVELHGESQEVPRVMKTIRVC